MRTKTILVVVVVLASASALASAHTTSERTSVGDAVAAGGSADYGVQDDGQNATSHRYDTVTIQQLELDNATVEFVRINATSLAAAANGSNETQSMGSVSALNLTVGNGTLQNVTLQNVTIRDATVAQQLFGEELPEGENATVENASLSNVTIASVEIENGSIESAEVGQFDAKPAPDVGEGVSTEDGAAVEIESANVGSAVLDGIEADAVGVENASAGVEIPGPGGQVTSNGNETTADGNESGNSDSGENDESGGGSNALRAPDR